MMRECGRSFGFRNLSDVAREASAFAIRARRPSRRTSGVGLHCAFSMIGVLRLLNVPIASGDSTAVVFCAIAFRPRNSSHPG
jgi:hypothetical protein